MANDHTDPPHRDRHATRPPDTTPSGLSTNPPNGHYTLRTTLVVTMLVPPLLAFGGSVLLLLRTVEGEAERRMKDDVELVARALRLPLVHTMELDSVVGGAVAAASGVRPVGLDVTTRWT